MTGKELAQELDGTGLAFKKFTTKDLTGKISERFNYYKNSQIAYEFSLKGYESNTQGFDLSLTRQFGLRKDALGFKDEAGRSRDVTRTFFVWDKFEELVNIDDSYCNNAKSVNIIYPITGSLPIFDLIYSYIEINELGVILAKSSGSQNANIVGSEKAPAIPAMGDSIVFKTRIDANMSPTFEYNPVGQGLLVSSLTLKNDNYREDTHSVIITVSTADVAVVGKKANGEVRKAPPTEGARLDAARDSIGAQRARRFDDAVINLSNSLSRLAQ